MISAHAPLNTALVLTGMAKEVLSSILAAAAAAPPGTSVDIDPGDLEGTLRSVLTHGSSYAQPLTPFCVMIIQNSLDSVSSKQETAEEATGTAMLALTALDRLVCDAAKAKANKTAANPGTSADKINATIQSLADNAVYAALPKGMAMRVVELVLSIIDSTSNGNTVSSCSRDHETLPGRLPSNCRTPVVCSA